MLIPRAAIVVRTHGGLGNQLFQIAYARLLAARMCRPIIRLHDDRYPNRPRASSAFRSLGEAPGPTVRVISALRLPKVLQRVRHRTRERVDLGHVFLDGYFQNTTDYEPFSDRELHQVADQFRAEFAIARHTRSALLEHIRLGDFFREDVERLEHLLARLESVTDGATVISDSEILMAHPKVQGLLQAKAIHVQSTSNMTAEYILRFMASHSMIRSNDSTLACWGAILGGATIHLADDRIRDVTNRWIAACA